MRFYALLFCATVIFTLPYALYQFTVPVPAVLRLALLLPAECLHYAAVMVHELSHAGSDVFFGYPAFPTFDKIHGGGTTFRWPQSPLLIAAIDLLVAGIAVFALHRKNHPLAFGLSAAILVQWAVLSSGVEDSVVIFMGHGGEVLAACLFLVFARRISSRVERGITVVFALHMYLRVLLLAAALLLVPARRASYAMQKGIPNSGDIGKLAALWHCDIAAAAAVMLSYTLVLAALAGFCIYKRRLLREAEGA